MKYFKSFFYPFVALVMFALGISELGRLDIPWAGWGYAACYPGCFCEAFQPGGIVQPLSSWSNLFYIAAGLLILGSLSLPDSKGEQSKSDVILPAPARRGVPGSGFPERSRGARKEAKDLPHAKKNGIASLPTVARNDTPTSTHYQGALLSRSRAFAAGYGIAVILIGVTSLFFHVSLTQVGRWFDYMGMYAFAGYALLYSLTRLSRWKGRTFIIVYILLLAALGALWVYAPALRRPALGDLILAIMIVEAYAHWKLRPFQIRTRWLVAALACFLGALAVNLLDESGAICAPASLWQWHVVWHLLTAASTLLLYVYYRSERGMGGNSNHG